MSDPASNAGKVAKVIPGAIDVVTGGALSDLRAQILPDVDALLRRKSGEAHDAMWTSLVLVARAVVANAHGVEADDAKVSAFINDAAADTSFAARTMRLISQGLRSPSESRRRMLALALFRPHPNPAARDRVDAAVERLEPADVELLRALAQRDPEGRGYKVLRKADDPQIRYWSLGNRPLVDAIPVSQSAGDPNGAPPFSCASMAIVALRSAECIDLVAPVGFGADQDVNLIAQFLHVLPLGRDVLDALKEERAFADIEESAVPR